MTQNWPSVQPGWCLIRAAKYESHTQSIVVTDIYSMWPFMATKLSVVSGFVSVSHHWRLASSCLFWFCFTLIHLVSFSLVSFSYFSSSLVSLCVSPHLFSSHFASGSLSSFLSSHFVSSPLVLSPSHVCLFSFLLALSLQLIISNLF